MPVITDLGKQGPHPEIITDLVGKLGQYPIHDRMSEADVQVLKQRTLYDVKWSMWSKDGVTVKSGNLDMSAGLVVSDPPGGRKQVIGYVATRLPDRGVWGIAESSNAWLDRPSRQPVTGCFLASQGIWIGVGGLAHAPELGSVRITLADGQAVGSAVSDGSFLALIPCDSAELWSSPVIVAYYDTEGLEMLKDTYDLSMPSSL